MYAKPAFPCDCFCGYATLHGVPDRGSVQCFGDIVLGYTITLEAAGNKQAVAVLVLMSGYVITKDAFCGRLPG